MNPVVPIALILTFFIIIIIVSLVLYFLKIWPFNNTKVLNPMTGEWVDTLDPDFDLNQIDPQNICEEPYCGGAWRSPQMDDIYQGTTT